MYEKLQVVLANGESYRYVKQGDGPRVLLLVHGNMSSSIHWKPLLERLPSDVTVLAPDLRGFGDSSYRCRIGSLADLADDLALFLDALGIGKADVAGWSTGGGIALEFAARHPAMAGSLVLIESTSHKGYPIFRKDASGAPLVGQVYASVDEMAADPVQVAPAAAAFERKDTAFTSWLWDVAIYTVSKPSAEDNALYVSETVKQRNLADIDWALATINMSDVPSLYSKGNNTIGKVQSRVLHIWSEKDVVVPRYMLDENVAALKELSEVVVFPDSGHSPLVDCPDKLATEMTRFLGL